MLEQNTFMETIREVSEIIRTAAEPLSKEEILGYFKDMELNDAQKAMVLEFLLTPHEEPQQESENVEESESEPEISEEASEKSPKEHFPQSQIFQMYLEELEGLQTYEEQELKAMYQKLLAGDETVIHKISDSWMKRVLTMAEKLSSTSEGLEDIVQEGNLALFLKLTELCGNGGQIDLEAELIQTVEAAIKASITELAGEEDVEQAMVGKVTLVNEAKKYLTEKNHREPTKSELADYTKLSESELTDVLHMIEQASANEKRKSR